MREALSFLTPIGGARQPTPAALEWFPLVGAGIGGAVGALWCTARSAMAVEVAVGRYVGGGLATAFGASSAELGATRDAFRLALPPACLGALAALGLAALGRGLGGVVAVVAAALAAAAVI